MYKEVKEVEELLEKKKEELLQKSEISLIVEKYDDIFSSFDPRSYSNRALSVDFLDEVKRATREIREEKFEIRLLVPMSEKKLDKETVIKGRLKEHFKKHANRLEKERRNILRQGYYFIVIGILFMVVAAYILFYYHAVMNFVKELLVVLLEPGGWFLLWEGLGLIIFKAKETKPDLDFHRKMVNAEIVFSHY